MAFPLCFSFPALSPNYHHTPRAAGATTHHDDLRPFRKAPRFVPSSLLNSSSSTEMLLLSGWRMDWSFLRGSKVATCGPKFSKLYRYQKTPSRSVHASVVPAASASTVFSLATTAVLPFYVLMLLAPKSQLTNKCMGSMIPDTVLGLLYGYVVYLSWTPDTLHLMFGSKYMVPQLGGITTMFSSEMRLTSAWIHLLAVDLFAARQVYKDGFKIGVETRHSVALCLLACPLGILTHLITKILTSHTPQ